ncbi:MAG: Hpt domain-containing protein [Syntrophales bacterium]
MGRKARPKIASDVLHIRAEEDMQLAIRAAASDLFTILPVPCLDVAATLKRLRGNKELYLKLLRDFITCYGSTPSLLLQELQMEQWDKATHRVHNIRGFAGNIGGRELEDAAVELEKACRAAGNAGYGATFPLGEPLQVLIDRYEELTAAIGIILARQPVVSPLKPEGPPGDVTELLPFLERLQRALASEEPAPCMEILGTLLQRQWPEEQVTLLVKLNGLVQRYRLAEAMALLDKKMPEIPCDKISPYLPSQSEGPGKKTLFAS